MARDDEGAPRHRLSTRLARIIRATSVRPTKLSFRPAPGSMRSSAFMLAVLAACGFSWAQQADPNQSSTALRVSEQSVKAAYLYKFAGYVEWPDTRPTDPPAPVTIGVLGAASLAEELAQITIGRTINDRPIDVRRVTFDDQLDDLQILFIGAQERNRLDDVFATVQSLPVLTVTESEGALAQGSIINFTLDEQRVRFEVSLYAAELSRIRLNSRLLAVAQRVSRSPE
jgi:hypothetical protein